LKAFRILALLAVTGLSASVPAGAGLQFLWPVENGFVRENVNVAVAVTGAEAAQVGYVQFFLNGKFIAAVGFPRAISGGREAYTWAWDTRAPINLGGATDAPKRPADGPYEVRAVAVSKDGQQIDSKTISVQLANQVRSVSPETKIPLKYVYRVGTKKKYAVDISVTLDEVGGAPVKSNQAVQSFSFTGTASVEDLQPNGRALVRYRPEEDRLAIFGRKLGPLPGFEYGSLYEIVSTSGRVVETDLFSTVGVRTDETFAVDYRTPLPAAKVQVGDTWNGKIGVSMPGISDAIETGADFTLEGLEWAGGREAARISSKFNTSIEVKLLAADQSLENLGQQTPGAVGEEGPLPGPAGPLPSEFPSESGLASLGLGQASIFSPTAPGGAAAMGSPGRVTGTSSDWFAFRTGDLIRREVKLTVDTSMDQTAVQRLTEGLGLSTPESPVTAPEDPGSGQYSGPDAFEMETIDQYHRGVGRIGDILSGSGRGTGVVGGTRVKLTILLSARLLG